MTIAETGNKGNKKLVENRGSARRGGNGRSKRLTNRLAEPHIRAHEVKGKRYYYYVRGTDREIYLGTANAILEAVKG